MPYVQRDQAGAIIALYRQPQPGYAEEELADDNAEVLAYLNPPAPARRLSTYRIVRRLEAAGLLPAAQALLDANIAFRWRFTTAPDVAVDDPDLVAWLQAIGADVEAVLAPE